MHGQNPGTAFWGLRVRSGWATAVLTVGSIESLRVIESRTIDLCDPAVPESRQPYHAAMGKLETNEKKLRARTTAVRRAATHSFKQLLEDATQAGYRMAAVGLVVGSEVDPGTIANPHIRAHALEGRLFRTVLLDAARAAGVPCHVLVEKKAFAQAGTILKRQEVELKSLLTEVGRHRTGPWRADEKLATLAALVAGALRRGSE